MKKVVLLIIFITVLGSFSYSTYKVYLVKQENQKLQNEIINLEKDNGRIKEENITLESSINKLKEENKSKWEELELWKKTGSKLEKALS